MGFCLRFSARSAFLMGSCFSRKASSEASRASSMRLVPRRSCTRLSLASTSGEMPRPQLQSLFRNGTDALADDGIGIGCADLFSRSIKSSVAPFDTPSREPGSGVSKVEWHLLIPPRAGSRSKAPLARRAIIAPRRAGGVQAARKRTGFSRPKGLDAAEHRGSSGRPRGPRTRSRDLRRTARDHPHSTQTGDSGTGDGAGAVSASNGWLNFGPSR